MAAQSRTLLWIFVFLFLGHPAQAQTLSQTPNQEQKAKEIIEQSQELADLEQQIQDQIAWEAQRKEEHRQKIASLEAKARQEPLGAIAIFSTTHNNFSVTEVPDPQGELKVSVVSLYRITTVEVPPQATIEQEARKARISIPYALVEPQESFKVKVKTQGGDLEKIFTLRWQRETKSIEEYLVSKPKPPLSVRVITGMGSKSNVFDVPKSLAPTPGFRGMLLVGLSYKMELWGKEARVNGVIYREKYLEPKHQDQEIAFSQVSAEIEDPSKLGLWNLSVGLEKISAHSSGLDGETALETDAFVQVSLAPDFLPDTNWHLRRTARNIEEQEEEQYNGDALAWEVGGQAKQKLPGVGLTYQAAYLQNQAASPYKDYDSWRAGIKARFARLEQNLVPELGYSLDRKHYAESDPLKGGQEESTKHSYVARGFKPWKKGMMFMVEAKKELQESNIPNLRIQNELVSVQLIMVF